MASTFDAFTNNSKTSELFERLRNWALNSGILAIKTTADPDAKTTAIIVTSIGGKIGAIAAAATLDLSALCAGTIAAGASKGVFLFADGAGTVSAVLVAPNADGAIVCPEHPITKICFGSIKIVNGTASTFTVGTTALDTASVTVTYTNHSCILPGHAI